MRVSITGSRGLTITHADIQAHLPADTTTIVSGGAPCFVELAAGENRSAANSSGVAKVYGGLCPVPSIIGPAVTGCTQDNGTI
jgi:hypothetical protein